MGVPVGEASFAESYSVGVGSDYVRDGVYYGGSIGIAGVKDGNDSVTSYSKVDAL